MYRFYIFDNNNIICKYKVKTNNIEDIYKTHGKYLMENGMKLGYTLKSQIEKYEDYINAVNKRKDNCYKIRASDLLMYLSCYCCLNKLNMMDDNHFFVKIKNKNKNV